MSSYSVSIRSDGGVETTIKVDSVGGDQRITEAVIRAPEGAGLTAEQLPFINVDLLLRALGAAAGSAMVAMAGSLAAAPDRQPPGEDQSPAPTRPRTRVRSRAPATKVVGKEEKEEKNDGKTDPAIAGPRTYRRMPADLREVYSRSGSVAAVAAYYDVPRHTAQGWIGRLRNNRVAEGIPDPALLTGKVRGRQDS